MQITNIACPNCAKSLKLTQALPAGTKVRCTGCGRPFSLPAHAPAAPIVAVPPAPAGRGFLVGLLVGGIVMLAGASVALALYLNRDKSKSDDRQAAVQPKKDDKDRTKEEEPKPKEKEPEKDPLITPTPVKPPSDKKPPEEEVIRPKDYDPNPRPKPDPVKPDPVKPDPVKPDPVKPDPVIKPEAKPDLPPLPRGEQEKVNAAVEAGLKFLKSKQSADGSWMDQTTGGTSFMGLVLLECGIPATEDVVVRVAQFVRANSSRSIMHYDVSCCILFLDRLGDPADRPLIRSLALRLMAGQGPKGGWGYTLAPGFGLNDETNFLNALMATRPKNNLELFVAGASGVPSAHLLGVKPDLVPNVKFEPDAVFQTDEAREALAKLSPESKRAAVFALPSAPRREETDPSDNSNTQFAILALLAAARHDIPVERALGLASRRFRTLQDAQGGWAYRYFGGTNPSTSSMTCAGLLGLAVGHGLVAGSKPGIPGAKILDDPGIQLGFKRIGSLIGKDFQGGETNSINPYFLWSVERLGVLFNLSRIDGKDWYAWSTELFLKIQKPDGSWHVGNYTGSVDVLDTCFALLVLKRANLAKELTVKINKLELIDEDKPRK